MITPDSKSGTQAWIDAYHDMHPASVQALPLKSGALQGALVIEYPFDHRFESLHIVYDSVNGQLPNLDLLNTAVSIASGQMGIGTNIQEMWDHNDSYEKRLQTMLRGMAKQGMGLAAGAHSSFIPYHIDAITLQTKGHGWQDEMALGRTVESVCRSLNNLLEHLHQSFFFYLLMQTNRFVSIGTYMPSAMLIAANFTIMAVALWLRSGHDQAISPVVDGGKVSATTEKKSSQKADSAPKSDNGLNGVLERQLSVPLTVVTGLHFTGMIPLYIFNTISSQVGSISPTVLRGKCPQTKQNPLTLCTVLSFCNIRLPRHQRKSPLCLRSPPRPRLSPSNAARLPPYQILLSPSAGPVPIRPRHVEFLAVLHDRPPLRTPQLHRPDVQADDRVPDGVACHDGAGPGGDESPLPAGRDLSRVLVHGRARGDGARGGRLWMGCVGDVDARGGVVCLVAGVVEWVFVAGCFYSVRIKEFSYKRDRERAEEKGAGRLGMGKDRCILFDIMKGFWE